MATSLATALANLNLPTNIECSKDDNQQAHSLQVQPPSLQVFQTRDEMPVVLAVPALAVQKTAWVAAMARLGVNLGVNYFEKVNGEETQNAVKARMLWETLRTEGWTQADFDKRFPVFLREVKFANWTIADFLGKQTAAKLYSHRWATKEQAENQGAAYRMEAYLVNGEAKYRYITDDENALDGLERIFFRGAWLRTDWHEKTQPSAQATAKTAKEEITQEAKLSVLYANAEKRIGELEEQVEKYKRWWERTVEEKHSLMQSLANITGMETA